MNLAPPSGELPRTSIGSAPPGAAYPPPAGAPPAWGTPPPPQQWPASPPAQQAAWPPPAAPPQPQAGWPQAQGGAYPQGAPQWGAPQGGWAPPTPQGGFVPGYTPPGFQGGAAFAGRPQAAGNGGAMRLIVIIAIIAGGLWWYMGASDDPKAVVNKCMDGIQTLDANKVLECVRPSDRAQMGQLPMVFAQAKAKGIAIRMEGRQIDIADKKGDSCVARCRYNVSVSAPGQAPQAGPVTDEIQMTKEGGKWYIVSSVMLNRMAQQRGGF